MRDSAFRWPGGQAWIVLTVFLSALSVFACAQVAPTTPGASAPSYDVIVRNGRVVDGGGNPWIAADVGIRAGRIARIGFLGNATAGKTLDASGLYVAPGFIDMHNHSDRGLRDPKLRGADQFLIQGVTSVMLGVDGNGTVELMNAGREWEQAGMGPNTGFYIGMNPIRIATMGIADREPTAAELERMKKMVADGMELGALGLSTGLVYIPSIYSKTSEVIELAKVAGRYGGLYDTHHRDEMVDFLPSLKEALEIGKQAGVPLHIAHMKVMGQDNWGQMQSAVDLINAARARGQEISGDQYAWPNGAARTSIAPILQIPPGLGRLYEMHRDLKGNPVDFSSPAEEREYLALLKTAMADPASREKIKRANEDGLQEVGSRNWIKKWGYGWLRVEHSVVHPEYIGMTLPDIGRKKRVDTFSVAAELALTENEKFVLSIGACSEKDVAVVLAQPWVSFSSDGELVEFGKAWLNPRSLGSFSRIYRKFVREEKVISLEDAVRKMTGLAARTLRLADRGTLREGNWADITVFDGERMADKATYGDPFHHSEGVVHVLVNGQVALEDGKPTGARAGKVMTRPK